MVRPTEVHLHDSHVCGFYVFARNIQKIHPDYESEAVKP